MKRKILYIFFFLLFVLFLAGCSKQEETDEFLVFYLNMDITRIEPEKLDLSGESAEEQIEELLDALVSQPESAELIQTIPSTVELQSYTQNGYSLILDFSDSYYELDTTQEVLIRAAIVRTMIQIKSVGYVTFTVESLPLVNASGAIVGRMNEDSFVENPGEQINGTLVTNLVLYFANSDKSALVKETRKVRYSSNISLEKLVLEQLIEGPRDSELKATIPSETKLITSSVVDGICYVNLDETVSNRNSDMPEELVLYSIVNSLTELATVDKVQISINGDTSGTLRYLYNLDAFYEADASLIEDVKAEKSEKGTE